MLCGGGVSNIKRTDMYVLQEVEEFTKKQQHSLADHWFTVFKVRSIKRQNLAIYRIKY